MSSEAALGASACAACDGPLGAPFFEARRVPCHSVRLVAGEREARAFPTGSVALRRCAGCGLVQNAAFEPARLSYDGRYEATQLHSPHFRAFAEELADRLITRFDLAGRTVVEIGCGQADFLTLLCRRAGCRGIGIDPAARDPRPAEEVEVLAQRFEDRPELVAGADLVLCRHTLEHIDRPRAFLRAIRDAIGERPTPLFLDVPESRRILAEAAFWDVYYEHCNYFDAESLERTVTEAGFRTLQRETTFHGQSLELLAVVDGQTRMANEPAAAADLAGFEDRVERARSTWRERLRTGGNAVLWGAGSKAVAFLAGSGLGDRIRAAVDINPHKHGHYLPGSGLPVIAPESLRRDPPTAVIAMNPAYLDEIRGMLAELGLAPTLWRVDDHGA